MDHFPVEEGARHVGVAGPPRTSAARTRVGRLERSPGAVRPAVAIGCRRPGCRSSRACPAARRDAGGDRAAGVRPAARGATDGDPRAASRRRRRAGAGRGGSSGAAQPDQGDGRAGGPAPGHDRAAAGRRPAAGAGARPGRASAGRPSRRRP
ncbi:MAG: hypothetical protein EPN99_12580 [Frankiales bacterium]|nr:MAG: hypothetical protein EPN99_12580 [Frankiales bacterium]